MGLKSWQIISFYHIYLIPKHMPRLDAVVSAYETRLSIAGKLEKYCALHAQEEEVSQEDSYSCCEV